jgi:hypothetical protein
MAGKAHFGIQELLVGNIGRIALDTDSINAPIEHLRGSLFLDVM